MELIKSIKELKQVRKNWQNSKSLGFVPTMGNLHLGHESLIRKSKQENERTLVSIFVNPTQFSEQQDLENYPKTLDEDLLLLKSVGVNYAFTPSYEDLYPDNYKFKITESEVSQILEGEHRPSHFDGVLTVLAKLFIAVDPTIAYFGEKDYQQLELAKGLAQAFFMDVIIKPCKTIRLSSGLPYSSRNNNLDKQEFDTAERFSKLFLENKSPEKIKQNLQKQGIEVEYMQTWRQRLFTAVRIGKVRLIDNRVLGDKE